MSRRINATEYDWPHEGWRRGTFLESPLPQAGPTNAMAQCAAWRDAWRKFDLGENGRDGVGRVTLIDNRDASHFRVVHGPDAELSVTGPWDTDRDAPPGTRTFGALVSCVGIGLEKVQLDDSPFSGPVFWSDDACLYAGNPLPDGVTSIVISGGGDGGMQDLQTAATSYCGGSLLDRIERLLEPEEQPDHQLRADLLDVDESKRRAYAWAATKEARLAVAAAWHRSVEKSVLAYFRRRWSRATFERLAQGLFREQLLDGRLTITWVVRESTPGVAYVLNRFLALLLVELSNRLPRPCIVEDFACAIRGIVPADGREPAGPVQLGVGKPYTVNIGPASGTVGGDWPVIANLILIRHGVRPGSPVLNGMAPVADQILPLGWP
jgi:hypothetical protein